MGGGAQYWKGMDNSSSAIVLNTPPHTNNAIYPYHIMSISN